MTIQEVCQAIEAETHTISWAKADTKTRLTVIEDCIALYEFGGSEQVAKKVVKQRKPRKPKQAPLTQHAVAGGESEVTR